MLWNCFLYNGVGKIEVVKGNMTAMSYVQILNRNLLSSVKKLNMGDDFIFQQDNDPKHKASLTNDFLKKRDRTSRMACPKSGYKSNRKFVAFSKD
ncbi:TCB1 [Hepatospora eriocheir]|uniref:TCB1 n=1 Tax=Hepatospora eriocheir TaxID=1081669 RepID=A0A1X0QF52_9MICR|nr:TCB1 [Hepatospora eriocheir]